MLFGQLGLFQFYKGKNSIVLYANMTSPQQDEGYSHPSWRSTEQSASVNKGEIFHQSEHFATMNTTSSSTLDPSPRQRYGAVPHTAQILSSGLNSQPEPSSSQLRPTMHASFSAAPPPVRSIPVSHLLSHHPPSPDKPTSHTSGGPHPHGYRTWPSLPHQSVLEDSASILNSPQSITYLAPQRDSSMASPISASPAENRSRPPAGLLSAQPSFDRLPQLISHSSAPYCLPPVGPTSNPCAAPSVMPSAHMLPPLRGYSPASSVYSSSPSQRDVQSRTSSREHSYTAPSTPRMSQVPQLNYNLIVRQQPKAARACGFGERDRRVIDPPPILQLIITSKTTGLPESDSSAMLALHCTLVSPSGEDDETIVDHLDVSSTRRLMGTLVASGYQAKDEKSKAGTFFVFSDLSCRSPGQYRLKFVLLRVDPMNMAPGAKHGSVATITSDVFSVYTAKDFPGMQASSALLKALRKQGLNVGVKKGSEARKAKGRAKKSSRSDSEEEAGSSDGDEDDKDASGGAARRSVSPRSKKMLARGLCEAPKKRKTNV